MAQLIDGKAAAARLRAELVTENRFWLDRGVRPSLRVILVGEHPASLAYVRTKERMAREVGIDAVLLPLPTAVSEAELLALIDRLNADPAVHGILVQLPLPSHLAAERIIRRVAPAKDVDGLHPENAGRLALLGRDLPDDLLVPCTPLGCLLLLEQEFGRQALAGKRALIVGRSTLVGRPLAQLLLLRDCTVTVAHSRSRDLPNECRRAEILVAAVGRPHMIRGDWIAEGAVVVDVGINRVGDAEGGGRLVGDVAFAEAVERAGAITPVPGGVGPMTVACLLANTLRATRASVKDHA